MRFLILVAVLALSAVPLRAQTPTPTQAQIQGCRAIQQSAERLACYDKAAPPIAVPTTAPVGQRGSTTLSDPIGSDQDSLKLRLQDICQRC